MTEYEMFGKEDPEFGTLDPFTQAYIEAAFWTSEEPGTTANPDCVDNTTRLWDPENENNLPADVGFMDLSSDALIAIREDCVKFQQDNETDLAEAYRNGNAYDESSAGHDFWVTRNHHGVGFWDRGLGEVGERLETASHACGECNLYLGDDGRVYLG